MVRYPPSNYSNFDSRLRIKDGLCDQRQTWAYKTHTMQKGTMFETAGYVITGLGLLVKLMVTTPARLRTLQVFALMALGIQQPQHDY